MNEQEQKEYQERMGGPEMEYLQHLSEQTPTQPDWREDTIKFYNAMPGQRTLEEWITFIQSVADTSYEAGKKAQVEEGVTMTAYLLGVKDGKEAVDIFRKRVVEELEGMKTNNMYKGHVNNWYNQALEEAKTKIKNL